MSRRYHNHAETVEFHGHSNQPYDNSSIYPSRESPRVYPMNRASPLQDQGSEKGEQQPRRRIGLACSRCRKRKIKCSGDIGGTGCQNCKTAQADECNFLRVNSTDVLPTTNGTIDVSYFPNNNAVSLPGNTGRTNGGMGSMYPNSNGMMHPPASFSGNSHANRNGSCNGQHYSPLISRHAHPSVAHTYNFSNADDHMFDHYAQAPHYLLPAQDLQASMSSTYGVQDMSRQWTPIAGGRNSLGGLDDPSFKYGTSGFPYLNSSAVASAGSEGFGMNSIGRALPRRGDRILPSPRRTSVETSGNSYPKSGESTSYGPPPGLGHKSSAAWSPQTLTYGASQGSISSTSLSAPSASISSVSSSPPSESSQHTTSFGYIHMSGSPVDRSLTVARGPESEPMSHAAESRSSFREAPFPKNRNILPMHSSNRYAWDTVNGTKTNSITDSLGSGNTLVSGLTYSPPKLQPMKYHPGKPLPVEREPAILPKLESAPVTTPSRQH
ncbi:MAG: hypothetical protein L6R35_003906 [Caloplaca aegaea]|nr:MAG: hypothetical protein L6R35_003906 [Caloplaca aegaea]